MTDRTEGQKLAAKDCDLCGKPAFLGRSFIYLSTLMKATCSKCRRLTCPKCRHQASTIQGRPMLCYDCALSRMQGKAEE